MSVNVCLYFSYSSGKLSNPKSHSIAQSSKSLNAFNSSNHSASCSDIKDADNIAGFCDEIYSAIPKLDKIVEELELHSFELGTDTIPVHYVRLNEAIEIVKQGGASEE